MSTKKSIRKQLGLKTKIVALTLGAVLIGSTLAGFLNAWISQYVSFEGTAGGILTAIVNAFVLVIFLQLVMNRLVIDRIMRLISSVRRIADGDLTVSLNIEGNDEISQLYRDINAMTTNNRRLLDEVRKTSHTALATSQSLSGLTEKTSAASEEIAASMQTVVLSIQDSAESSQELAGVSGHVRTSMGEGVEQIDVSIAHINALSAHSKDSVESISSLRTQAEQIRQILGVIRSISEQTNMLALNAAIEAARAGENGRGFSVVANEVRELAEESSEATEKINTTIKSILEGIDNSVMVISSGSETVQKSVLSIKELERIFDQIEEAVTNLDKGVERLAATNQEIGASSEQVTAAIESQAGENEHISNIAHDLSGVAENIKGLLGEFNLKRSH